MLKRLCPTLDARSKIHFSFSSRVWAKLEARGNPVALLHGATYPETHWLHRKWLFKLVHDNLNWTEQASRNLPSAGRHCWDKARRVECLMCLGSARHPHIVWAGISFCLSGWALPNQNEIWKSGWQMLRERDRDQDKHAACKFLQPKNYLLHKVSKNLGLHTGSYFLQKPRHLG